MRRQLFVNLIHFLDYFIEFLNLKTPYIKIEPEIIAVNPTIGFVIPEFLFSKAESFNSFNEVENK
jgi:hypothetical protein